MGFAERLVIKAIGQLSILAPSGAVVAPSIFKRVHPSDREYDHLLSSIQRLRGTAYLRDGAISATDLDSAGRHCSPADRASWHVAHISLDGEVMGCARYRAYPHLRSLSELDARHAALASDHHWGRAMRQAVRYELLESSRTRRDFFEVSGWAIAEQARHSQSAFTIALATYALGRILGGGRGIATATTRNRSSCILRRLGGQSLSCEGVPLPPYFDPKFGCVMEVISFDTARPHPKYSPFVQGFVEQLPSLPVVYGGQTSSHHPVEFSGGKPAWEMSAA